MKISKVIIALVVSIVVSVITVRIDLKYQSNTATSFISTFSAFFTIGIAWLLYDKFDARKLNFAKKADAVDSLMLSLTSKSYTLCRASLNELDNYAKRAAPPIQQSKFYLNWHNLENPIFLEENINVYFSQLFIDHMKSQSVIALNPMLPSRIRESIKPFCIFKANQFLIDNKNHVFIVVTDYNQIPNSEENYYILTYDDKRIDTIKDLKENLDGILTALEVWYKENFDEVPDFGGN